MKPTVLIVEDNPIARQAAREILSCEGYAVVEAASGAEAVAAMSQKLPNLVLQDMALADIDGFALIEQLRGIAKESTPPILAFTGRSDEQAMLEAGFSDVLRKPVDADRLVAVVEAHLKPKAPTPTAQGRKLIILVDDDAAQLRLDATRLRHAGFEVECAHDGFEATAMLDRLRPDLVLSDLNMPELDGFELCQLIRADPRHREVPVLLMTAHTINRSHQGCANRVGASGLIQRPPGIQELRRAVNALLTDKTTTLFAEVGAQPDVRSQLIDQLRLESAFKERIAQRERTLTAISTMIGRVSELSEARLPLHLLLAGILENFLDASGFPLGAAYLTDASGRLQTAAQLGFPSAALPGDVGRLPLMSMVLRSGSPRGFNLGSAGPVEREILERANGSSAAIVPISLGQKSIGALLLVSHNASLPNGWVDFAAAVASPIAHVITLARTIDRLGASERQFRGMCEATVNGILLVDGPGQVSYVNPAAEGMLGQTQQELLGRPAREVLPKVTEPGSTTTFERPDGTVLPLEVRLRSFEDSAGYPHQMVILHDRTEHHRIAHLSNLADTDPLTGLYNRRRFEQELSVRLADARRHHVTGSLLVFDLDRFKPINDTHGHQAGDLVLKAVADCLRAHSRETDTVARLGGDEFVVLINHSDPAGALSYAAKVREAIAALALSFEGHCLKVGVSVGIAHYTPQPICPADLFALADQALYAAKRGGRDQVVAAGAASATELGR